MNKTILIVSVIIIAGVGFWYWQNQSSSIKDCETDSGCFSTNFRSCTPSRFLGGGVEVVSGTPESCRVMFDNPKSTYVERLTMECTVKNANSFKDEEINAYSVYEKGSVCNGSLYDFFVKSFGSKKQ